MRNNDAGPLKTWRANRDEEGRHRLDAVREIVKAALYQIGAWEH